MKRIYLAMAMALTLPFVAKAQEADNYPPRTTNGTKVIVPFSQSNLPIFVIDINHQMIQREDRIVGRMRIINNGAGATNYLDLDAHPGQTIDYDGYIALKYRGNSSFNSSDKKPYSIKTLKDDTGDNKQKVSLLGMGKDNDWVMIAPYADRALFRDKMVYDLTRAYFEYVPHLEMVELVLDGTYYGVYMFGERVRPGKYRINLPDPGVEGDDITGGYLVEIDRSDEDHYTSKYCARSRKTGADQLSRKISYQYKSPEYADMLATPEQLTWLHNRIDEFEGSFRTSTAMDLEGGYREYADVPTFIAYMLATEFSRNNDGYRLSTNLYKYRDSVDKRFKMSLWDFNLAFGNANYYSAETYDTWAYDFNDIVPEYQDANAVPFWWYVMLKDENFVKDMHAMWKQMRANELTNENIEKYIDEMAAYLKEGGAVDRNFTAWNRWGAYVWPITNTQMAFTNYDQEIDYLKTWIRNRVAFMDEAFIESEPVQSSVVDLTSAYNADVIAEGTPVNSYISETLDSNRVLYSTSLKSQGGIADCQEVTSANNVTYMLGKADANNAFSLKGRATATLTFDKEISASALFFLTLSTSNSTDNSVGVVINYADGTTGTGTIQTTNWSNATSAAVLSGFGNINVNNSYSTKTYYGMYQSRLAADQNKAISSLTFNNTNNLSAFVMAMSAADLQVSGIDEVATDDHYAVRVYPSPVRAGNPLYVEAPVGSKVEVIDMAGSLVRQSTNQLMINAVSTAGLAKGVYLVKVTDHGHVTTKKVVVG